MVMVKGNCTTLTNILATVSKTTSAGVSYLIACCGTFIAGDINNLNNIGVFMVTAHSDFNALRKNCTFFINATTHC